MADFNFYLNRQGVRGQKGEQGEAGFSPFITVDTATANDYRLKIQNEFTSFTTPNLRGNAIEDTGGTYIRFNPEDGSMYTGLLDSATNSAVGGVLLSTYQGLVNGGDELTVPTSVDVYNFVTEKISEAGLNFDDLSDALVAGNNVTLDVDSENSTITINSTDTTYTAGDNVSITGNVISATDTIYTAGDNVTISPTNKISVDFTGLQSELIADVPLYIEDITADDRIVRQTYIDNSTSYSMPIGNTNYLRNMTQHAVNPARDIVSYPADKTDIGILAIPYKTGQIVKACQLISSTNYYYATIGQIYNGYPVQTLGFTMWSDSVTATYRLPLFSETTVKDAIDQNEGTSFSVEGTSVATWTSSLGQFSYQIKYDDNNDTYTLIVKHPSGTYNQTFSSDSNYYNTLKNTNYVLIVSSNIPKNVGIVSESDNADLTTVDLSTLNFKSIDDFYSDDTPLGTHIYLDTSTSLNSSSTHLTVPTSKTVYDAIQSSAQTYAEGTGISILNNTISVNYDSSKGLAANGTTGALGVRVDGTTIDFDASGNLSYVGTMPTVTVDQVYDSTSANPQSGVAIAGELSNYALSSSVPTDTSDLTNNAGFITSSALSGYATETWVGNQGFLTSADINDMATQTWVTNQGYLTSVPTATTSAQGVVQPDGTTIDINNGVISVSLDTTVTSGSSNAVTSGAVYTAIDNAINGVTSSLNNLNSGTGTV